MSEIADALKLSSFVLTDGHCFDLSLLPGLRKLLCLDIDVLDPVSRQRLVDPGDFENKDPQVDVALFDNGCFCLIADINAFFNSYICRYCRREFSRPNNLKKHEQNSCTFVKWREINPDLSSDQYFLNVDKQVCELVFVGGPYKAVELLGQKLDKIGIELPFDCGPFVRSIMCVDIECMLTEAKGEAGRY